MKTNINLIKITFISLILLSVIAQAKTECSGNTCLASFAKSSKSSTTSKDKLVHFKKFTSSSIQSVDRDDKKDDKIKGYFAHNAKDKSVRKSYLISNRAVQIGAFSQYTKAKNYAKRYKLMGDQFSTKITKVIKNRKTMYRVQIEGFESHQEAKQFVAMYSNTGAFLVKK